jgi:hypothetical protein
MRYGNGIRGRYYVETSFEFSLTGIQKTEASVQLAFTVSPSYASRPLSSRLAPVT